MKGALNKTKAPATKPVHKDHTTMASLQGKYDDQPVFQEKVDRANFILKKYGVPKFD